MLNSTNIQNLHTIFSSIETENDLKALYHALEPLKIGVSYYTDWRDKKVSYIWHDANKNNIEKIEHDVMWQTWKVANGNFVTFQHLAEEYFATNGTKEQRILELISKLLDKNWFQGKEAEKAIEKATSKNWRVKRCEDGTRPNCYILDLTKPLKLRGMNNSQDIEDLQRILEVEITKIPYYGEWSIRDKAGDYNEYTIFLNGNIMLKNDAFRVALIPYIEKWISQQWNTVCYKI